MTDPITIVIADDHPLFRFGLLEVLRPEPAFRVVGEAEEGEQAMTLVRRERPDVVILDIEMPACSGLEAAERIRDEQLGAAAVILTLHSDAAMFQRALDLGVRGYVLKDSAVAEIVNCVHMVAAGKPYISPALSGELLDRRDNLLKPELAALSELTPAEHAVLRLVAEGLTSARIADELGNSVRTIEHHRSHICNKLALSGPQALLRYALENRTLLM